MMVNTIRRTARNLWLALLAALALLPFPASADQADIEAASRGVVRVIIAMQDGEMVYPVSHGSGFAVTSDMVVTNAHVVRGALRDPRLVIAIVPPDGGEMVRATLVDSEDRNDLALLQVEGDVTLQPLTIAVNPETASGVVTALGYPRNVELAQGLDAKDIMEATDPVPSTGFLSGERPSREFDTVLHTAPIARGNSGGPLVDECGRVLGVNSFGAESASGEAEFSFAISPRELLPFLRANDVQPRLNALRCRSIEELDAVEQQRADAARALELERTARIEAERARQEEELRRTITYDVIEQRANLLAIAVLLAVIGLGALGLAGYAHRQGDLRIRRIAGGVAAAALVAALIAFVARPSFSQIESQVHDGLAALPAPEGTSEAEGGAPAPLAGTTMLTCVLDVERSRVTGAPQQDIPVEWAEDGCVNGRTQYGLADGRWRRVLVPEDEAAVSINSFDPATREFVMERYLLDSAAMTAARDARSKYDAPQCGAGSEAANAFGTAQLSITNILPQRPQERLVYNCAPARN